MTPHRALSNLSWVMMALPVILGSALCDLRPDGAWAWVMAMVFLPASRLGLKVAGSALGKTTGWAMILPRENTADAQKRIAYAMSFAGLVLSVLLGASLAAALGLIDDPTANVIGSRMANVLAGLFLMSLGNQLPKMLTPLSDTPCDPATVQTVRRRTGWAHVLTGLLFTVAWLVLPLQSARSIGMALMVAGILVPTVIMRCYCARKMRTKLQHSGAR